MSERGQQMYQVGTQGADIVRAPAKLLRNDRLWNWLMLGTLFLMASSVMFGATGKKDIGRDSGVFLYVGQRILAGDIPYTQIWDHKGPVIYYLNALGLLVGQGSYNGVIVLEYLCLLGTVWLSYTLLQRAFGRIPAAFASVLLLSGLAVLIDRGNWTEEYALPFQLIALYAFWRMETGSRQRRFPLVVGATGAIALLLRPNLVGLQIAIGLYAILAALLSGAWRQRSVQLTYMLSGASAVIVMVALYFNYWGALDDLWDASVRFNLFYSESTSWSKLYASLTGFKHLGQSGIAFTGLLGWIAAGYYCFAAPFDATKTPLCAVAFLQFPIEFALVGVSGRTYVHYYIVWLPVLTVLSSIFAWQFLSNFGATFTNLRFAFVRVAWLWLIAILAVAIVLPARATAGKIRAVLHEDNAASEVVTFVQERTPEHSYLLIWGAEAEYNFLTQRPAPTRFVYQSPVFTPGYTNAAMFTELLHDIAAKQPLIIDASSRNRRSPPLLRAQRAQWPDQTLVAEAAGIFQYIDEHYEMIATVGKQQWPVFAYRK